MEPTTAGPAFAETALMLTDGGLVEEWGYTDDLPKHNTPQDLFDHVTDMWEQASGSPSRDIQQSDLQQYRQLVDQLLTLYCPGNHTASYFEAYQNRNKLNGRRVDMVTQVSAQAC